jgi:hypothetical protein
MTVNPTEAMRALLVGKDKDTQRKKDRREYHTTWNLSARCSQFSGPAKKKEPNFRNMGKFILLDFVLVCYFGY